MLIELMQEQRTAVSAFLHSTICPAAGTLFTAHSGANDLANGKRLCDFLAEKGKSRNTSEMEFSIGFLPAKDLSPVFDLISPPTSDNVSPSFSGFSLKIHPGHWGCGKETLRFIQMLTSRPGPCEGSKNLVFDMSTLLIFAVRCHWTQIRRDDLSPATFGGSTACNM